MLLLLFTLLPVAVFSACDVCEQYEQSTTWQSVNDKFEFACPDGWQPFNRTKGLYCMKIFDNSYPQYIAASQCALLDAYLPGIESTTEFNWIVANATAIILADSSSTATAGNIWVGGSRVPACSGTLSTSAYCSPSYNAFIWGDYFLAGPNLIMYDNWYTGEPDNADSLQNCVSLYITIASSVGTGTFMDVSSGLTLDADSIYTTYGYVCGKPADIVGLKPTCSTS